MPIYTVTYTKAEIADLVRRDLQNRTGRNIAASQMFLTEDGDVNITMTGDQMERSGSAPAFIRSGLAAPIDITRAERPTS